MARNTTSRASLQWLSVKEVDASDNLSSPAALAARSEDHRDDRRDGASHHQQRPEPTQQQQVEEDDEEEQSQTRMLLAGDDSVSGLPLAVDCSDSEASERSESDSGSRARSPLRASELVDDGVEYETRAAVASPPKKRKRRSRVCLGNKRVKGSGRPHTAMGSEMAAGREDAAYDVDREFEIEKIIARRSRDGQHHYLIRWKGYSAAYDTWEPADNLTLHARQWFEEDMEAGRRDRRTGRLKPAVARQRWRTTTQPTERPAHTESDHAIADSNAHSLPLLDTEASGRGAGIEPDSNAFVRGEQASSEQAQFDREEEPTHPQAEQSSHSAIGNSSPALPASVSSLPPAAVGLSVGRQRRSIRPPRPYSPCHYVSTPRRLSTVPMRRKKLTKRSSSAQQSSDDGGDGAGAAATDRETEAAADNVGNARQTKHASFRQRQQLHVSSRRMVADDVIDLATSADEGHSSPSTQQHHSDDQHRTVAADSEQHEEHELLHTPSTLARKGPAEVREASELLAGDVVKSDAADVTARVVAPSTAELTYEVEAVVDRRFSPESMSAGCCLAPDAALTDDDGTMHAATYAKSSGPTLLPDDEWDEGCSGNGMQCSAAHPTRQSACHPILILTVSRSPPSTATVVHQDSNTGSSGWVMSHTRTRGSPLSTPGARCRSSNTT